jgi:diguanylate cyclase (GGDEF)-like protein
MERERFLTDTQTFFRIKKEHENTENGQALRVMKLREMLRENEREQARLLEKNTLLLYKMDHDELSGLYNKRSLNRYLEEAFTDAMTKKLPLGIMFIDIDYFKQLNDTYGHQKGDECIVTIANIIKECVADDYVARYGGDEFVVVALGRSKEYLMKRAEELMYRVKNCGVLKPDSEEILEISVTVGGANAIPVFPNKIWDFLTAADETLYAQKDVQKGCVRFYEGQGDNL